VTRAPAAPDDQAAIVAFLSDAAAYGPGIAAVERIDTHAAHVFLAGERAFKMKRAVRFAFLDYSTLARRRWACEREIEFNRRTAPAIYRGLASVNRDTAGRLALDGPGEPVEWLVAMRRFDQAGLFDRLAAAGRLSERDVLAMADAVLDLHAAAERFLPAGLPAGPTGGLAISVRDTLGGLHDHAALFGRPRIARFLAAMTATLERLSPLLERRCAEGYLRRCHGDLHLRNICLIGGEPRLFDCIEFNDALACIDVLYDLAFLLMDLCHRDLRPYANRVFNRYLAAEGQDDALAALPFFLALRAGIRAWVDATSAMAQRDPDAAAELRDDARRYFAEAEVYLAPPPARLVAIGGFSGSGKSTLARALAPDLGAAPGALVLRSDVIRKLLWGVAETGKLPPDAYASAISARVYETMRRRAALALGAGHAVLLDAVHDREVDRSAVAAIARAAGVPFVGVWLEVPGERLAARVGTRAGDASDADEHVVALQLQQGAGSIDWPRLDAAGEPDSVARAARRLLGIS
jgi:aminoglycoside phosphotransferase family enzyme/predicted kinase